VEVKTENENEKVNNLKEKKYPKINRNEVK